MFVPKPSIHNSPKRAPYPLLLAPHVIKSLSATENVMQVYFTIKEFCSNNNKNSYADINIFAKIYKY